MKITGDKRLSELDAMRGIAVMIVVFFHCTMFQTAYTFKYGAMGVELFFMISGFVIFMTTTNIQNGREFIAKRFARLYPIYWVCVTLTFIVQLLLGKNVHSGLLQYLMNLTMIQRYFNVEDLDGQYWSLAVEIAFYILVFVLYKLKQLKNTELILAAIVLVEFGFMIARRIKEGPDAITYVAPSERYLRLLHFLPLFLAGILFYKLYIEGPNLKRYLLLALCFIAQVKEYPNRHVDMFDLRIGAYSCILGVFFILFILFVNNKARFFVNPVTLFMGRISYALYLFHQYIIIAFLIPYFNVELRLPSFISCVFAIAIVVLVAAINTLFIDEPLRKKVKNVLLRTQRTSI